ncbi:MAG: VWA domain-containing protein [Bacteroidia bacterium]
MSLLTQTDELFSGFVEFGEWMDAATRRALSRLLVHHLFEPDWDSGPSWRNLKLEGKSPVWSKALGKLLEAEKLRMITAHNEALSLSVARHAIDWLRDTHQRAEAEAPNRKAFFELKKWQQKLTVPATDWQSLVSGLRQEFPGPKKAWAFFSSQLSDDDDRQQILLRQNILGDWENLLQAESTEFADQYVENSFNRFEKDLRHRYSLLNQLGDYISPFLHILNDNDMHLADSWNKMPWEDIETYVHLLEEDPNLKALVELLGRWETAEAELREASRAELPLQTEWKPQPYGRSEITGITHSDRIESVLPAELGLLSHPETELLLSIKYVEKKLLTFQHRSEEREELPKIEPLAEGAAQRGPIILCIDTSGSMFGQPELVAKAMAFAITSRALEENRPCFLISFSTDYRSLELSSLKGNLQALVDFIKMSFHGGTDIKPALEEALKKLKEEGFEEADVLVVSDFILPRVPQVMLDDIQEQRSKHSTRFHSLYISRRIDPRMIPASVFDHQWVYNLSQPGGLRRTVAAVNDWL